MEKFLFILGIMLVTALIVGVVFFGCTTMGRTIWNQYWWSIKHIDDSPTPEQRKEVESTCKALIASWEADVQIYQQSNDTEEREQAKIRANKTAEAYNEYLMRNAYVFNGNMPIEIYGAIDVIK